MEAQPETTTPIEEKHSFNWQMFVLWPFLILVLYVLSSGPVVRLVRQGRISRSNGVFIERVYGPVAWAYERTPLHKPLGMYFHLWAPKSFDKNGDVY